MLWVRPLLVLAAFAVFPLSTCDEFFGHHNGKVYERGSMAAVESEEVSSGSSEYDDDRTNKQPAADGNKRPTKRVERAGQQSLPSAVNVGVDANADGGSEGEKNERVSVVSKAVINPPPPAAPQGNPVAGVGGLMPMPIMIPPIPSTTLAPIVAGDDPVPIIHRVFRSCLGSCLCPSPRLEDWQLCLRRYELCLVNAKKELNVMDAKIKLAQHTNLTTGLLENGATCSAHADIPLLMASLLLLALRRIQGGI